MGASDAFYFHYSSGGELIGYAYKTADAETECILVKNQQGDVERVISADGTILASYTYDAWGNVLTAEGSLAASNPIRYRGYYFDAETGLYYVSSRYYDPEIGRFINADGYASTGQGVLSYNMFAYCGNNPVNRKDPTGQFWSEIWEFAKTVVSEIGKAIGALSPAYAGCGGVALADGPLPIGDMAGLAGAILLTVGAIAVGISHAANAPAKAEEKDITISSNPQKQAYFPLNPYEFAPRGLIMHEYPGTKNGRIIEWRDPISKAKIFEWEEDIKNGPHYHVMEAQWGGQHRGVHYLPGASVPEPWNSIYFGG